MSLLDPTTLAAGTLTSSGVPATTPPRQEVVATVLWLADLQRVGHQAVLAGLDAALPIELSRHQLHFGPPGGPAAPLGSGRISRSPLRFSMRREGLRLDFDATRVPVSRGPVPLSTGQVLGENDLHHGVILRVGTGLLLHLRQRTPPRNTESQGLVGCSADRDRLVGDIATVAPTRHTVLVRGPTGTGKELVARAIHRLSGRSGPFLAVNVATMEKGMAASLLFGHVRGAFTGAHAARRGWFREASGGTLFLDEVAELPMDLQAMLLRVLDDQVVHPVGGSPTPCDTRVVAATDADLEGMVAQDLLRAPLLHRLAVCTVRTVPLRDRLEDVAALFVHFVGLEQQKLARQPTIPAWLDRGMMEALLARPWAGNVRELRNVAVQSVIFGDPWRALAPPPHTTVVVPDDGAPAVPDAVPPAVAPVSDRSPLAGPRPPRVRTDAELAEVLAACAWEVAPAARQLGMAKNTLVARMRRSSRFRRAVDLTDAQVTEAVADAGGDVRAAAAGLEVSERALRRRLRGVGPSEGR